MWIGGSCTTGCNLHLSTFHNLLPAIEINSGPCCMAGNNSIRLCIIATIAPRRRGGGCDDDDN
jgi:hypothetical protein